MAFRLELQEYLSHPIGALSLGVGAGKGVQRICPCPSSVHFSPLLRPLQGPGSEAEAGIGNSLTFAFL